MLRDRTVNKRDRRGQRGQILVIFAVGLVALLGGVAIVVDGGNALAQQRATQNGADAVSEAGTVIIAQYLMNGSSATGTTGTCDPSLTPPDAWDLEVCKAVYGAADNNNVTITAVNYTDFKGDVISAVGSGYPAEAQGIQALTDRAFGTYFARALGISSFTASTQATAITGEITDLCVEGMPCGLFPITVPYITSDCDNTGKVLIPGTGEWPYLGENQTTPANEAIVPICKNQNNDLGGGSAGSVGWLDLSSAIGAVTDGTCTNQFKDAIIDPCIVSLPFETWVQTFAGGVGQGGPAIQDALNTYHNDLVQIPLFDGTCKSKPAGTGLLDCPVGDIGVGVNTWYHIPMFANFKVDFFYLNGNDKKQCDQAPGQPFVSGNGSNGCLKGWWVAALPGPGTVGTGDVDPDINNQLGVKLIR
jgi:Flp pilus assembly protein TadG